MSRYFTITFQDLDFTKQDELINEISKDLYEKYGMESINLENRKFYVEPKTWQERYCRSFDIGWKQWNDLEEKSEEFQNVNWDELIKEYADSEAELKLSEAFRKLEVEV